VADDDRLLDLLAEALVPPAVPPPPERVAAVRRMAETRHGRPPAVTVGRPPAAARGSQWTRRSAWSATGLGAAVAALVVGLLVLPGITTGGDDGRGSPPVAIGDSTGAVARLRSALVAQDPVAVARADADLLRQAPALPGSVQDSAVAAHIAAVQFLRDRRSPEVVPEPPAEGSGQNPSGSTPSDSPSPFPVPEADVAPGVGAPGDSVPDSRAPSTRSVNIRQVVALLDGTFQVEYVVAGFEPDVSGSPGTWAVRFSFDDDQAPTLWGGSSPWSFPVSAGLTYRQVCAHVVDAAGVVDPASGGCHAIL